MNYLLSFLIALAPSLSFATEPSVVPTVDLERYSGLWYQVGHFPSFFLKGCEYSTAEYGVKADGTVSVLNKCYKSGKVSSSIEGTASAPNPAEPTKLKVSFNIFAKGDYWIVDLDADYQWAVVSNSKKSSLFILSRQGPMDQTLLDSIVQKLKDRGFETSKIIFDKY